MASVCIERSGVVKILKEKSDVKACITILRIFSLHQAVYPIFATRLRGAQGELT